MKVLQNGDFQRGQFVVSCLAGTFVTKMAPLLSVSRAAVPEGMTAYTNHWKTPSAKLNSG
jgi:hypothetical protein